MQSNRTKVSVITLWQAGTGRQSERKSRATTTQTTRQEQKSIYSIAREKLAIEVPLYNRDNCITMMMDEKEYMRKTQKR